VNRNDGVVVFGRELRIGTEQLLLEQIVVVVVVVNERCCCCYGSELRIGTVVGVILCRKRNGCCSYFVVGSELSCYFFVGRELRLLSKLLDEGNRLVFALCFWIGRGGGNKVYCL